MNAHATPAETTPRPMTRQEMRAALFEHLGAMVRYWRDVKSPLPSAPEQTETGARLEGLLSSILVMLDGADATLPGFRLVPAPMKEEESFARANGDNWWASLDLAGGLNSAFPFEICVPAAPLSANPPNPE